MNYKNIKNLLLLCIIVLIIAVSVRYSTHYNSSNYSGSIMKFDQEENITILNSINIQNNVLFNYFNSLYESQISSINEKYSEGLISSQERNKQLNAVITNSELTNDTLTKLSNTKKILFSGNLSDEDILIHNASFSNVKSDIKNEINDTLYDQ